MSDVRYQVCISKYGSISSIWLWNHSKRMKNEFLVNFASLVDDNDFYAGILNFLYYVVIILQRLD
ncbi:hypothetical protein LguiB_024559 [Lonicera macranthoides]